MKKGISLIEVLIGAALFLILVSTVGEFFVKEYKVYNEERVLHKERIAIYDTAAFIESIIKYNIVTLEGQNIIVKCNYDVMRKIVYDRGDIYVLTYKGKDNCLSGKNTITPYAIKNFHVEIFDNYLIIIYMQSWGGYEYYKCISI